MARDQEIGQFPPTTKINHREKSLPFKNQIPKTSCMLSDYVCTANTFAGYNETSLSQYSSTGYVE